MSLARRFHFARHTRPGQIAARLRLTAKRKLMQRLGRPFTVATPPLSPTPPLPVFAPRELARDRKADLAGHAWPIVPPVDWHNPGLETGTRLIKLNLHYMEYLEGLDDTAFAALVSDWIAHNPPYRPGYWLDNWNSYALSIRVVVWMQQLALRRDRLSGDFLAEAAASLAAQLAFLARNIEADINGNHLMKNIKALLWAGRFFEGPAALRWTRLGLKLLRRELAEQVLPDGFHYERSPAYHGQVLADLLEIRQVLDEPAELDERLARMAQVTADTIHGDGLAALFNDGGLHMTYAPAELLRIHGGTESPRERFTFPDGGLHGARIGPACLIVQCGAMGPDQLMAHAHGDILSFELSWGAQRLIVDPGVYEYNPGPRRAYSRATASHNTVSVDGADQGDFFGAFRVGRRGRGRLLALETDPGRPFMLAGTHDGFAHLPGAPAHRRGFRFDGARLEIEDRLTGGRGQRATGRLLLDPACRVEALSGREVRVSASGVTLTISSSAASLAIGTAPYSPDFGRWLETACIDIDHGRLPCENLLVLELQAAP